MEDGISLSCCPVLTALGKANSKNSDTRLCLKNIIYFQGSKLLKPFYDLKTFSLGPC